VADVGDSSSGVDVGLANNELKEERARRNRALSSIDSRQMVKLRVDGDELKKVERKRRQETLAGHEGVLSLLGLVAIVSEGGCPDRIDGDKAIVTEEVAISGDSSSKGCDGDGEDQVPSPNLRLLEDQVEEDLEIGRVVETKRLLGERLGSALEVFGTARGGEINERCGMG
jgi:hypothetical protein